MIMLTTEVTAMMFSYVSRFKFVAFGYEVGEAGSTMIIMR